MDILRLGSWNWLKRYLLDRIEIVEGRGAGGGGGLSIQSAINIPINGLDQL